MHGAKGKYKRAVPGRLTQSDNEKSKDDIMNHKVRVLFVCLGNICRSPTAEALFRHSVKERGLEDSFSIESCGLGTWNLGQPPHPDTQAILKANNIPFDGMRAKQLSTDTINSYDYILAMDQSNVEGLLKQGVDRDKVQFLTDYVESREGEDVPDPYYHGNFDEVFALIREGVNGLLDHILVETGLDTE